MNSNWTICGHATTLSIASDDGRQRYQAAGNPGGDKMRAPTDEAGEITRNQREQHPTNYSAKFEADAGRRMRIGVGDLEDPPPQQLEQQVSEDHPTKDPH